MKLVFIAHPVAGDIPGNVEKILLICKTVHLSGHIPAVPYIPMLQYLDDTNEHERQLGMEASMSYIRHRVVDELWLFGDSITGGMQEEIELARQSGVLVVPKTPETQEALARLDEDVCGALAFQT